MEQTTLQAEAGRLKRNAYMRTWYAKNKAHVSARVSEKYRTDPEFRRKNSERMSRWLKTPKGKAYSAARAHTRRAKFAGTEIDRDWVVVLKQDPCVYCNGLANEIDHIDPNGTNEWTNLAPACRSCNGKKWSRPLVQFLHYRLAS